MKLASILALSLMMTFTASTCAASADITKITCKQLTEEHADSSVVIIVLLYGFILKSENKTAVDVSGIDADVEKFEIACDKRPDASALSVATETLTR